MAGVLANATQELRAERAAQGCTTDVFPGRRSQNQCMTSAVTMFRDYGTQSLRCKADTRLGAFKMDKVAN